MSQDVRVKICGLKSPADVLAAANAGAAYVGFNYFKRSPRYVDFETSRSLAFEVPIGVVKVALTVNAENAELDALTDAVPTDMLQLHGNESPERVAEVRDRYGLPVMKVLGISTADDLAAIDLYSDVADQLMLDAKPPKDAILPGGNGITFDWKLLADRKYWTKPWMLAGGLNPDNVKEAIQKTGTRQVDVASGVESAPGIKDYDLITSFVTTAKET